MNRFSPDVWADTDVVPYAARVSVWGRWFILLVAVFQFLYRPTFWYPDHVEYTLLPAAALALKWTGPLPAANGPSGHVALAALPQRHGLCFDHGPASSSKRGSRRASSSSPRSTASCSWPTTRPLALLVVVFASMWFGLAWTTVTAVVYSLLCMTTGPGLDLDLEEEKLLLARVAMMYALVLFVSLSPKSTEGVALQQPNGR